MVLKILHLHWPPHAPLLAPRCRPGQVVALSEWPVVVEEGGGSFRGTDSPSWQSDATSYFRRMFWFVL